MKKILILVVAKLLCMSAFAQENQRGNADSVSARRLTIVVDPRSSPVTEIAPRLAFGYLGEDIIGIDCDSAYQNRSDTTIFVNLMAVHGHNALTGLFVKRTFGMPWVNAGFVRDAGTTTVLVAPGAIYCPVTNNWGSFSISVPNPRGGTDYMHPVTVWVAQEVAGFWINTDYCYSLTSLRTELDFYRRPISQSLAGMIGAGYSGAGRRIVVARNDPRITAVSCLYQNPEPNLPQ